MKQHRYRITVEHLADAKGAPSTHEPLSFAAVSHDDIIAIARRMQGRGDFDADTAAQLAIGIKLFGEVVLENRTNPMFAALRPHFSAFMKELKKGPSASEPPPPPAEG